MLGPAIMGAYSVLSHSTSLGILWQTQKKKRKKEKKQKGQGEKASQACGAVYYAIAGSMSHCATWPTVRPEE